MSDLPSDRKYTPSHEWARDEGDGTATIGITDHAQELLGDLVYVELPEVGREVAAGNDCAVVESVKAASDIYSPVGGRIVEVNEALADAPERVNASPYGEGWIAKIEPKDLDGDLAKLMDAEAYREHVAAQEH